MKHNNYPSEEVIWITGASSGIGKQLAISLANAGNRVIITARNVEALKALACQYEAIEVIAADITDEGAMEYMGAKLEACTAVIDRLILNAGVCEYFDVKNPDWDMMKRAMAVNYFGAIQCLAAALPLLKRSARGHIVAMASQASRVPFPRAQAYGPSKAALSYLIESLGVDFSDTSIDTTVVQLGFVDTPMTAQNDFPMPLTMTVEKTADRLISQMMARPRSIRFPRRLSWVITVAQIFPNLWYQTIAPRLSRAS